VGVVIIGLALLASATNPLMFFASGALFGLGFGAVQAALLAFAFDRAPLARRGGAASTVLIAGDLGQTTYAATVGRIVPLAGYAGLFLTDAALLAGALLVYLVGLRRSVRKRRFVRLSGADQWGSAPLPSTSAPLQPPRRHVSLVATGGSLASLSAPDRK
jgi:MFS family permease